jgi:hypothetical protein
MRFTRVPRGQRRSLSGNREAILVDDGWDDYSFQTLFELVVFDAEGQRIDVGGIKILKRGMTSGRVPVPQEFEALDDTYCSLGQDENYYETLATLVGDLGDQVLRSLRDCVQDPTIYFAFKEEPGFHTSLLRAVAERSITTTFSGALGGQATLTPFHFSYTFPNNVPSPAQAAFAVDPESMPPTNVHVVIGRNGVGKTRLLGNVAAALCQPRRLATDHRFGLVRFYDESNDTSTIERFANLVAVTFSAFDPFVAPNREHSTSGDIRYSYVGLKKGPAAADTINETDLEAETDLKGHEDLVSEFRDSLLKCRSGPRRRRWLEAILTLETDPGFEELGLRPRFEQGEDNSIADIVEVFRALSSGHKIVLLSVSRLVELVDERTLVLLDEPEAHLHPPLLSSFVRVLSALLKRRNGVAIVATHSPVVLQEVPSHCVWLLRRAGEAIGLDRPQIETFGENVGVLTREVFGLEVTASGFHQLIADKASNPFTNYEEVVEAFGGHLGAEARAIARALLNSPR